MSDIEKTIAILENIPKEISPNLSMREISEVLSIMFSENDSFEPTIDDFINALYIKLKIEKGLDDIEKGNIYTTEELKRRLKNGNNLDWKRPKWFIWL